MVRGVLALAAALAVAAILARTCGGRTPRPNILLLSIETFRHDRLGRKVNGISLTPNLDKLAAGGTNFERAYSAASFTLPSLTTIATGEPPRVHRVQYWTRLGNPFTGPTLASLLKDEGYRTGFIYSTQGLLRAWPILNKGWTEAPQSFEREDGAPVAAASAWLDRRGTEPFFLWVHLFEPHAPYAPADEFLTGLGNVDLYHQMGPAKNELVDGKWVTIEDWAASVPGGQGAALADALYEADIRAADAAVAKILADLERRGLEKNTIVCVVSDHGENLSLDPTPRWEHGVSVDEQLIRVPLIFAGQGIKAGVNRDIARHLDLAPTLLHLAGIEPQKGWLGRDLFGPSPPPKFAIAECTISESQNRPMYSVTDGDVSLRLYTAASPWVVRLRDERNRGARERAIDLAAPVLAPEHAAAWEKETEDCKSRALLLNDPTKDDKPTDAEQQRVLDLDQLPYGK